MHFHFDALFKRVGLFVASKPDMRVLEQLVAHRVAKRVVLLRDHYSSCVLLSLVVDALD